MKNPYLQDIVLVNSKTIDERILKKARKVFQPYYKEELTDEQIATIMNNLMKLYYTLKGIAKKHNITIGKKERGKDEKINIRRNKGSKRY